MSYITPNSTVKLLRNCPLDKSYRDTWYFESTSQQRAYFESLVMVTFTAISYQRVRRNVIRLEYNAENLYSVNYMMFQNTNYNPTQWFYAFVDYVEYVNDNTCNVYYTIDVLQTWFFTYSERPCFIQRMSVADDTFGNNIEPEPFNLTEYVCNGNEQLDNLKPVIVAIEQLSETNNNSLFFENTLVSAQIIISGTGSSSVIGALSDMISSAMVENPNDFIDVHMALVPLGVPKTVAPHSDADTDEKIARITERHMDDGGFSTQFAIPSDIDVTINSSTLQGYRPYNNKLYTYPFNFLNIFTANGDSMSLRYEFFTGSGNRYLRLIGNVLSPVCVRIYPVDYKNYSNGYCGENISITGTPACSWSTDAYTSWLAQNSVPIAAQTYSTITSIAMSAILKNPAPAINTIMTRTSTDTTGHQQSQSSTSYRTTRNPDAVDTARGAVGSIAQVGINSLTDMFVQGYQASLSNQVTKGSYNNGNITFANDLYHFYGTRMSVPNVTAYRIDQYFDAFGYAINAISTPQRHNRKRYTYVQTRNCLIDGDLPASDRSEIEKIYNEGIRFWVYGQGDLGTYVLSDNGTL